MLCLFGKRSTDKESQVVLLKKYNIVTPFYVYHQ